MGLRLVSEQASPLPCERPRPTLSVIENTSPPAGPRRATGPHTGEAEWPRSETGRVLPNTHKWRRLKLNRYQATKQWRALADELDRATDRLAETDHSDAALAEWNEAALKAITAPWAGSLENNLHNLRTRIGLTAVLLGERFRYGGIHDGDHETRAELAFAMLDHAVATLLYGLERQRE